MTSAATAKVHEAEQEFGDTRRGPAHYGYRILPLVVTKSPIASCSLGESGDAILSLIDSCWISTVHEIRDEPVRSLVINYTAFKTFITELAAIYGRLGIE